MSGLPTKEEIREKKIRDERDQFWLKTIAEVNTTQRNITKKVLKNHGLNDQEIEKIFQEIDEENEESEKLLTQEFMNITKKP